MSCRLLYFLEIKLQTPFNRLREKVRGMEQDIELLKGTILSLKNERQMEKIEERIKKLGLVLELDKENHQCYLYIITHYYLVKRNLETLYSFTWFPNGENATKEINTFLLGLEKCANRKK